MSTSFTTDELEKELQHRLTINNGNGNGSAMNSNPALEGNLISFEDIPAAPPAPVFVPSPPVVTTTAAKKPNKSSALLVS